MVPPAQGGRRAPLLGYLLVGASEDEDPQELLEDHPVGDVRAMAAERVVRLPLRQQGRELLPDGLDDVWWQGGHGNPPSGSLENSPDDGASVPVSHPNAPPIGASSYFIFDSIIEIRQVTGFPYLNGGR
jgi:hypothetical protein